MIPSPNTSRTRSPQLSVPFRRRRILWATILLSTVVLYVITPSSFWEHAPALDFASDADANLNEASALLEFAHNQPPGPVIPAGIDIPLPGSAEDDDDALEDIVEEQAEELEDFAEEQEKQEQDDDTEMPQPGQTDTSGQELQNLLHMVAMTELRIPKDVDASKPLAPSVYGADLNLGASWLKGADSDPPVIVFSKTTCPYSKKAKELLSSLDLSPVPKVVEVDRRGDTEQLKAILTRLTGRATFPNIFLNGQSLGGSDELHALMDEGSLVRLFESGNVRVNLDMDEAR